MDSAERIHPMVDGGVTLAAGFTAGAVYAGIKSPGQDTYDLAVLASDRPAAAAAVFTQNSFAAAPVLVSREHIAGGNIRGIIVNAGNANACTGEQGLADAREMARIAADRLQCEPTQVLVASTGIIGTPLPMDLIRQAAEEIELNPEGARRIPRAIMTTDTRPKEAGCELNVGGRAVRMGGIAKGAGMIHPNMATMLAFVTTDAAVDPAFLQDALRSAADDSFNMISIDGDTSTNDTLIVLANGAAGNETVSGGEDGALFTEALTYICSELAKAIVADGEGATKLIRMVVRGARTRDDARAAARSVVRSNLVKAAVYGADPNWGRVLCAIGYSGAHVDPARTDLHVGGVPLVRGGAPVPGSREAAGPIMKENEIEFVADLHVGDASATAWGCDLTEAYVVENSAYTT